MSKPSLKSADSPDRAAAANSSAHRLDQMTHAATTTVGGTTDELVRLLYDQLRQLARHRIAGEPSGLTLQPTALVHEVYLRLVSHSARPWSNRSEFFAAAAEAMRRILVERARRQRRLRHGGGRHRVTLADVADDSGRRTVDVLALDDALERLADYDVRKRELVKLRYFAGCTIEEAAEILGVSVATANSDWAYAKAWLHRVLNDASR